MSRGTRVCIDGAFIGVALYALMVLTGGAPWQHAATSAVRVAFASLTGAA
jgi:hypothetical protein